MSDAAILLVHGAWGGSWTFQPLVGALRERGLTVHTIELPSLDEGDPSRGLYDDAAAVAAAIDAIDGPVVVLGHSYGGAPVTQGANRPNVRRLIYVAAFALDAGEMVTPGEPPEWQGIENGMVSLGRSRQERIAMLAEGLGPDDDPALAEQLADMMRPHSRLAFTQPITEVAWRELPTTYFLSENDEILEPETQTAWSQRIAKLGGEVVRLPARHAPFLADPAGFADRLAARVR